MLSLSMWYCIIAGAVTLNIHIKAAPSIKLDKQQQQQQKTAHFSLPYMTHFIKSIVFKH